MPASLTQGCIVWATIPDSRGGNAKTRPAVVVTPTAMIDPNREVKIAAITTLLGEAPFSDTVEIPSNPQGHPQTLLKKRSEVVCTWVISVPVANLRMTGGVVPDDSLFEIVKKVKRLT